jgi:hypothetical protein
MRQVDWSAQVLPINCSLVAPRRPPPPRLGLQYFLVTVTIVTNKALLFKINKLPGHIVDLQFR